MPRVISLNVGLPRDIDWRGQTVHTGIWKLPVTGRLQVRRLNIDGDGQGDLAGHGGENRAVMVYQVDSYRYWESQLGRHDFTYGQFGENFTVDRMADDEVCVGDRYRIGTALFEVTQPRVTCYRVGIRTNEPEMPSLLVAHHRPGFYFRVLEEGEVGPGDEILKVADGPERMTIRDIDALLYLPGRTRTDLERALRIPALSKGWKGSFQGFLSQAQENLAPAWKGFRPLRVAHVDRESQSVVSLSFAALDGSALPAAQPGQFLVLKLQPAAGPAILRNYSMSGRPGAELYRVSVKREAHGLGSAFIHEHVSAGSTLEVSAPRGTFTLRPGTGPVVLISAGIGATPVLAMLQALAAEASSREVWWLYGARDSSEHPFAVESRALLGKLARSHSCIVYSHPGTDDRQGEHYDAVGHLDGGVIDRLELPRDADFYLCGPERFMRDLTDSLKQREIPAASIHTETFGPEDRITPGIAASVHPPPHQPAGVPEASNGGKVAFARSSLTVAWDGRFRSLLELAEACDIPVKWACRTGVCHTCESALIGGTVNYSPDPLEPPSDGNVLICCSQPGGDIELDL